MTFTTSSGLLAGTPGQNTAGTYPLQFTSSNGLLPDAIQSFTLTVNPVSSGPANLTFTDATCTSFVLSGVVQAANAAGLGAPAQITVTWH